MTVLAIAYIAVLAVMAGMDFTLAPPDGGPDLSPGAWRGDAEKPDMWAAVAFYLLYGAGVVIFRGSPCAGVR